MVGLEGTDETRGLQSIFPPQLSPGGCDRFMPSDELVHVLFWDAVDVHTVPVVRKCKHYVFSVPVCAPTAAFQPSC